MQPKANYLQTALLILFALTVSTTSKCRILSSADSSESLRVELLPGFWYEFQDSVPEKWVIMEDTMWIYPIHTDSTYAAVTVFKSKVENVDSVSRIDGVDANIFKLVEAQEGDLISASTDKDQNSTIIAYQFKRYDRFDKTEYMVRGYWFYYRNYGVIAIQFQNAMSLDESLEDKREAFLRAYTYSD